MRRIQLTWVLLAMTACVGCTRVEDVYEGQKHEITFNAVTYRPTTKAFYEGTSILSGGLFYACILTRATPESEPVDYLKNVRFLPATDAAGSYWTPQYGKLYYPLSGYMDILAFYQYENRFSDVNWLGSNPSVKARIRMRDYEQTEVLYGALNSLPCPAVTRPTLTFHHSTAMIKLNFIASDSNAVRINSVYLDSVSLGGDCEVTNDVHNDSVPQPMAVWTSLSTPKQTNNLMTGNPFILSHRTYKQAGQITVPAQTARKLKINYSLINPQNNATNWDYEVQLPGTWEMGNCYTYNFRINMYTIDLNSVVAPWNFEIDEDF